ncbi:MAG: citrate lyase subunit alpha [Deltaproteobacteria bacterium]|nr:citrate lyase subunit alpha [Deltaproteobacteria bacterium]
MINAVGRELPAYIEGYGPVKPFAGVDIQEKEVTRVAAKLILAGPAREKVLGSVGEAIRACGLTNGMTISFHHCLRNGDRVLNMVLDEAARIGLRELTVAATAIFPVHAPLIGHMESGVVTGLCTNYLSGPVAKAVSGGILKRPVIMHTHGGRVRAIAAGEIVIDAAFVAASACDEEGNMNGVEGKSAFGVMGYSHVDSRFANRTVAVTDTLVDYPACPIEINQQFVDFVVPVESIGDASGIVSGTTRITEDPVNLKIAAMAAGVIEASGLLKNGFSFQTGAGGTALAVAARVRDLMKQHAIEGSFASGGITAYMVQMLEEGYFRTLLDCQCFDLKAIESFRSDKRHQGMTMGMYGNPHTKGTVVNHLDVMILGATEIDTDFNVNVTTGSNGILMGGSGGHSDTAAGAKLAIIVTRLASKKYPSIVDRVTTVTTPGETIDVVVTEGGIAVNPRRTDLLERLAGTDLRVVSIDELKHLAEEITGPPEKPQFEERIAAVVEYRDGTVIDVVRQLKKKGDG